MNITQDSSIDDSMSPSPAKSRPPNGSTTRRKYGVEMKVESAIVEDYSKQLKLGLSREAMNFSQYDALADEIQNNFRTRDKHGNITLDHLEDSKRYIIQFKSLLQLRFNHQYGQPLGPDDCSSITFYALCRALVGPRRFLLEVFDLIIDNVEITGEYERDVLFEGFKMIAYQAHEWLYEKKFVDQFVNQCTIKLKIVLLGDAAGGKSSLSKRYFDDIFTSNLQSTIGVDFRSQKIQLGKVTCNCEIWDTCGQERFNGLTKLYGRGADGAVIVFDTYYVCTLENNEDIINYLHEKINKYVEYLDNPSVPIVLFGSKSDLVNDEKQNMLSSLWINENNTNPDMFIGSAQSNLFVSEVFDDIIQKAASIRLSVLAKTVKEDTISKNSNTSNTIKLQKASSTRAVRSPIEKCGCNK
jgi:small GTP-binding protein